MSDTNHVASQGECVASIAFNHGFAPDTIWTHPENEDLRSLRILPSSLLPGDEVFVPELEPKDVDGATEAKHRFRRKGVPAMLRLQFFDDAEPRAGVPYVITIDGVETKGNTDADGRIEVKMSPGARDGKLKLGPADHYEEIDLQLGHMDPVEEVSGVQARLRNLGRQCADRRRQCDQQVTARASRHDV